MQWKRTGVAGGIKGYSDIPHDIEYDAAEVTGSQIEMSQRRSKDSGQKSKKHQEAALKKQHQYVSEADEATI